MMQLSLYIEGQRITLYPDESIKLKRAVQSLQDITKIFTDFTQSFKVPADDNNNAIFKHYYDAQIVNGFDARTKKEAAILIDGITIKKGKIQLTQAMLESNVVVNYSVQFFGDTIKIKDLIGDDTLRDLDLSAFTHSFNYETIKEGATTGLFNENIKYPLLSYDRQFAWLEEQRDDVDVINIKYDPSFTSGLDWRRLKPSLRADAILEAIKTKYGLIISDDFFSRDIWQRLYMSIGNGDAPNNPFAKTIVYTLDRTVSKEPSTVTDYFAVELKARVTIIGDVSDYKLSYIINGNRVYESSVSDTRERVLRYVGRELPFGDYTFEFEIDSKEPIEVEVDTEYSNLQLTVIGERRYDVIQDTVNLTTSEADVIITNDIEDLKIVDWLIAITKAFNLVIVPNEDGSLYFNDIPNWYSSGKIVDISEYVDISTLQVERGKLYNQINFGYEEQESLLANQYEKIFGQQFGGFESRIEGIAEQDELSIKLPFENPQFERLSGSPVQYAYIVDKDLNAYGNKTFLHYAPSLSVDSDGRVGISNDEVYEFLDKIFIPSHSEFLTDGFAFQFNAEFSEYTGDVLTDNLYSRFYQDYINDLFSERRRTFTVNAELPITVYSNLELNTRLIIKGDRYIIDNIDTNLLTGKSKIVLINDIFETISTGEVSRLTPNIGVFKDRGSSYYTGADTAVATTNDLWINITNPNISNGQNLSFTLDINNTGTTRTGIISVTDGISDPILTILQDNSSSQGVTADSTIVTADNDLITI